MSTLASRKGTWAMSHAVTRIFPGGATKSNEWTVWLGQEAANRASPHPKSATRWVGGCFFTHSIMGSKGLMGHFWTCSRKPLWYCVGGWRRWVGGWDGLGWRNCDVG